MSSERKDLFQGLDRETLLTFLYSKERKLNAFLEKMIVFHKEYKTLSNDQLEAIAITYCKAKGYKHARHLNKIRKPFLKKSSRSKGFAEISS